MSRYTDLDLRKVTLLVLLLVLANTARSQAQTDFEYFVYLPIALRGVTLDALPPPSTSLPTALPSPTPQPSDTPPPSATPTASSTPTQTPLPTKVPGRIRGQIVVNGMPIGAGFGISPIGPQIELRLRAAGAASSWETIARAETDENGIFEFDSAPPLEDGQAYHVFWNNTPELGLSVWLYRWTTDEIDSLASGEEIDLGAIEVTDLKLTDPSPGSWYSLPNTFSWQMRSDRRDSYRWALAPCEGTNEGPRDGSFQAPALGYASRYELASLPRGFGYDVYYCWYVAIENNDGTGWSNSWRKIEFRTFALRGGLPVHPR